VIVVALVDIVAIVISSLSCVSLLCFSSSLLQQRHRRCRQRDYETRRVTKSLRRYLHTLPSRSTNGRNYDGRRSRTAVRVQCLPVLFRTFNSHWEIRFFNSSLLHNYYTYNWSAGSPTTCLTNYRSWLRLPRHKLLLPLLGPHPSQTSLPPRYSARCDATLLRDLGTAPRTTPPYCAPPRRAVPNHTGRLVGWSVGPSVRRSVGRSVDRSDRIGSPSLP